MFSTAMQARLGLVVCGLLFVTSFGVLVRGSIQSAAIGSAVEQVQSSEMNRVTLVMK